MKKIISILLSLTIALIFTSCDEDSKDSNNLNYVTIGQDIVFEVLPDGTAAFDLPVYVTKVENFDRSFDIKLIDASTTADPSAFTIPSVVFFISFANSGNLAERKSNIFCF